MYVIMNVIIAVIVSVNMKVSEHDIVATITVDDDDNSVRKYNICIPVRKLKFSIAEFFGHLVIISLVNLS